MSSLSKRKLRLIEVPMFPKAIETSQLSQCNSDNGSGHSGSESAMKFVFTAKIHNRVLAVTFFDVKSGAARLRIFFSKKSFITQRLLPEQKWSSATLGSMWQDFIYKDSAVCADEKSSKAIGKFFGSEGSPYEAMRDFQDGLRKKRLAERHKKEMDEIDDVMKAIRPLPKDFMHWANEVSLDFSRYIFYKRKNARLIEGYCTSCKNDVTFCITKKTPQKNVRHNERDRCPKCKRSIIFKAEGKVGNIVDESCATYFQKTKTGFVMRYFAVSKGYSTKKGDSSHYRHPTLLVHEEIRHFFDVQNDRVVRGKQYRFDSFKMTDIVRWCEATRVGSWSAPVYTRNLRHALRDTPWKYCAIYELAKNAASINAHRYFGEYEENHVYEYLVKARLYRLVLDSLDFFSRVELNFNGKNLPEVLKVSKFGIRQIQRFNGGSYHLKLIRIMEGAGYHLTDELLKTFIKMDFKLHLLTQLLEVSTPQKVINYINRCLASWEQKNDSDPISNITTYWRDYLSNCVKLGYDLKNDFNVFPPNLKASHDRVYRKYAEIAEIERVERATKLAAERAKEAVLQSKIIAEMYKPLQDAFGFTHKGLGLIAVAPSEYKDIVTEGELLRHCVHTGSYIEDMVKGEGYVMFVRKADEPNQPYYTAEIVDGVIQQCRGRKNADTPEDVKEFVSHWQNRLKKKNASNIKILPAPAAIEMADLQVAA